MGHQMLLTELIFHWPTDPCCYGNKIYDKMGYTSAYTTNITKFFASDGGACWGFGNYM